MPNIEMHGVRPQHNLAKHREIAALFEGANYQDDIVVTLVADQVFDVHGQPRPFLRVIFTQNEPSNIKDDCLKRLISLNMDTEVVMIWAFIPKKT